MSLDFATTGKGFCYIHHGGAATSRRRRRRFAATVVVFATTGDVFCYIHSTALTGGRRRRNSVQRASTARGGGGASWCRNHGAVTSGVATDRRRSCNRWTTKLQPKLTSGGRFFGEQRRAARRRGVSGRRPAAVSLAGAAHERRNPMVQRRRIFSLYDVRRRKTKPVCSNLTATATGSGGWGATGRTIGPAGRRLSVPYFSSVLICLIKHFRILTSKRLAYQGKKAKKIF